MDILTLFTQGGFALVAIGCLIFIIKWFMREMDKTRAEFLNHTSDFTKQVKEFSDTVRMFTGSMSEMAQQLRELSDEIKRMNVVLDLIKEELVRRSE